MVCSVDHLASEAGVAMMRNGGSAADAAIAADGFPPPPTLVASAQLVAQLTDADDFRDIGPLVRRPGVARALADIAKGGRAAFYEGEFGEGLRTLGNGEYTAGDLARSQAEWV